MTDRRKLLQVIAGAAGAAGAGAAVTPCLGLALSPSYTDPPFARAAMGSTQGWTEVARLDDVPVGRPVQLAVTGSEVDAWTMAPERRLGAVWVLRRTEAPDSLTALSAVCPHLGCLIEREGDHYNCPCHVSAFAGDGRALTGPSPRAMDPIDVRVHEGAVLVRWVRYRLGVAQRVEEG